MAYSDSQQWDTVWDVGDENVIKQEVVEDDNDDIAVAEIGDFVDVKLEEMEFDWNGWMDIVSDFTDAIGRNLQLEKLVGSLHGQIKELKTALQRKERKLAEERIHRILTEIDEDRKRGKSRDVAKKSKEVVSVSGHESKIAELKQARKEEKKQIKNLKERVNELEHQLTVEKRNGKGNIENAKSRVAQINSLKDANEKLKKKVESMKKNQCGLSHVEAGHLSRLEKEVSKKRKLDERGNSWRNVEIDAEVAPVTDATEVGQEVQDDDGGDPVGGVDMLTDENSVLEKLNLLILKSDGGFKCKECDKTSLTKNRMHEHVETHLDNVLLTCDVCSKTFQKRSAFTKHKTNYHSGALYSCESCNKIEMSRPNYRYHMKRYHDDKSEP